MLEMVSCIIYRLIIAYLFSAYLGGSGVFGNT